MARILSIRYFIIGSITACVLTTVIVVHTFIASWLLDYVNKVLNHINGYEGSAQSINIDLYRGAYRINKLVLNKKEGNIPVPFIAIDTTDFSIQWLALLHGRVVSEVTLLSPSIHFAVNESSSQTGNNVDWTKPIRRLMPIDINHVWFRDGTISYQDFASHPQVNIYIHHIQGEVSNLRNVVDQAQLLPSTITIHGASIGNGELSIQGRMNILKKMPDVDLLTKLENVQLTALNDYSNAYGGFDFKDGIFHLYSEFIINNEEVSGYVKPVAQHIAIIDLHKTQNPLKLAWESVVAGIVTLFTNHTYDQFATKIPLTGDLRNIQTDDWSAIANIFHNAFVQALRKGFDANGNSELPH